MLEPRDFLGQTEIRIRPEQDTTEKCCQNEGVDDVFALFLDLSRSRSWPNGCQAVVHPTQKSTHNRKNQRSLQEDIWAKEWNKADQASLTHSENPQGFLPGSSANYTSTSAAPCSRDFLYWEFLLLPVPWNIPLVSGTDCCQSFEPMSLPILVLLDEPRCQNPSLRWSDVFLPYSQPQYTWRALKSTTWQSSSRERMAQRKKTYQQSR